VIVTTLYRGLARPLFRALSGAVSVITKVFVELELSALSHYTLSSSLSLTADFKITAYVTENKNGEAVSVLAGESTNNFIARNSSTTIRVQFAGTAFNYSNSTLSDGKLHSLVIERISNTVTVYVDGISAGSNTHAGTFTISAIGSRNDAFNWDGIISDIEIEDTTTPANTVFFALNDLTGSTETNNGITATYQNIATTADVRDTYTLNGAGNAWVGSLQTIDIAP
jgi:hypothetical protein